MTILVITTGGTIGAMAFDDPKYPPKFSAVPADNRDFVREHLEASGIADIRYANAGHRDSKLIDEAYRADMQRLIESAPENSILITHGTDTLLQSADFFYRQVEKSPALAKKTVFLTGAMTPLANGPESDGYMNLKFSLELLAQEKTGAGVYIVLCDYEQPQSRTNWAPNLYHFQPGQYEKFFDPQDGRYHRLRLISG